MNLLSIALPLITLCASHFVCSQQQTSSIRSVDFANFSYPARVAQEKGWFKLRNGELQSKRDEIGRPLGMWLKMASVDYGDVNGDGIEDAIINIHWITGGSATPNLVYIYTFKNHKPLLLWAFETGDRADGGYKRVYAEAGNLVVELNGKNKVLGTDLYADDGDHTGVCCALHFTRARYKWRRSRFGLVGKPEVLPLTGM